MTLGFVVLSHDRPGQVARLVRRLVHLYGAPVVVHHDFSKSRLDATAFQDLPVRFVQPHVVTAWGGVSVSEALLRALSDLYTWHDPDWFFVLSASDYPIVACGELVEQLTRAPWDAFLDHRRIAYESVPTWSDQPSGRPYGFNAREYPALAYDRYVSVHWRDVPSVTRRLQPTRRHIVLRRPWITRWTSPFRGDLECYAGETWLSGNRRAAGLLTTPSPVRDRLMAYYRRRENADESFIHTLLCNSTLRINPDHRRYIDWSAPVQHPRTLGIGDVDAMLASGRWFARKFMEDDAVLDALDAAVRD